MLHYFDRASMAHSLEVRVPFLDHQLVEFCATIPADSRSAASTTKHVLKHAARGLSPTGSSTSRRSASSRGGRRVVRGPDARRDQRLPPRPEPALCRDARPPRRSSGWSRTCRRQRHGNGYAAALDPDARGLAVGVPAARALDGAAARERSSSDDRAYAVITPARDEAENLPRLAASLAAQTEPPRALGDRRQRLARTARSSSRTTLAAEHAVDPRALDSGCDRGRARRADRARAPRAARPARGRPAGFRRQCRRGHLDGAGLLRAPPRPLRRRSVTRDRERQRVRAPGRRLASAPRHRRDASGAPRARTAGRACSRCCRSRSAWRGTASTSSRRTRAAGARRPSRISPFRHHRREGERDGTTWRARSNQGHAAYYVGYRPWYLVLRALFNARREPAALGMIAGYAVGCAAPRAAERRRRGSRLPPPPAEHPEPAGPVAGGDRPPRPRGLTEP